MKEPAVQTKMPEAVLQKASATASPVLATRSAVHPILQLQRAIGNQGVQRLIQAEFTITQPGLAQQQGTILTRTEEKPSNKSSVAPKQAAEFAKVPSVDEATSKEGAAAEAPVGKEIPRAFASPEKDPAFQKAKNQVNAEAKKQKKGHAPANKKRKEAEKASALKESEQIEQDSQEKNTEEMERKGTEQRKVGESFSAETFKIELRNRIKDKGPKTESQAKEFAKKPPIEHFEEDFSKNVAAEQGRVTGPLKEKADPKPKGGVAGKTPEAIPPPIYPSAPKAVDPKLATPKPKTDQEISLQDESDRLDVTMQKNRLSDEQLADSREPSFVETLKIKQETKQKLAEAPGVYRQQESAILQGAEAQTNESLSTELKGMSKIHHTIGGHILGGQQKTESETEKRQREIKEKIGGIYQGTVIAVKGLLESMANKVKEDFAKSLKEQTELFNKNVTSRLDNYYSFGKKAKHFFLGEPKVVVDENGNIRSLTREDWDLSSFPPRITTPWINPEVYDIFLEEKKTFLDAMDVQLGNIANDVQTGLNAAQFTIQLGKTAIAIYKATLKGDEKLYADGLEAQVTLKFANLEGSIDDAREDLLQALADQYSENVDQLEKTFNEINDELKKSWVDRAIEFIETVGKTIFQLAELLLSILVRVAHLVWDIIKHPIRFFETLVSGLKQGIGEFVGNIGTYMQEAFWTWITGATAVKNIRLSAGSGIRALFDLVMQVLSLGPNDLRAIVEKVLGKEFMEMVDKGVAFAEKALEPVTILLTKGPVAFWDYLVDSLESVIQSAFDRIKESVFYAFVEKGLKWIAGFFIPGGGFVKIVKAIVAAFQFVAANLDKIRQFFDSVFDSMEDAVAGNPSGVATKIVKGLTSGVVLALDFLARQLGLEKLVDSVQKILQSIRRPIVNAIEWVLGKVKPFVMKLMKKGKELWAKGKAALGLGGKPTAEEVIAGRDEEAVPGQDIDKAVTLGKEKHTLRGHIEGDHVTILMASSQLVLLQRELEVIKTQWKPRMADPKKAEDLVNRLDEVKKKANEYQKDFTVTVKKDGMKARNDFDENLDNLDNELEQIASEFGFAELTKVAVKEGDKVIEIEEGSWWVVNSLDRRQGAQFGIMTTKYTNSELKKFFDYQEYEKTWKPGGIAKEPGSFNNPFELAWPKPASHNYPTLYFGGKTDVPIMQKDLENLNGQEYPAGSKVKVKAYTPHGGGRLSGGEEIGLKQIHHGWHLDVGTKVGPLQGPGVKTPGGGAIINILKKYGFDPNTDKLQGDHVHDVQLGGEDSTSTRNLWPLDSTTNQNAGPEIARKTVNYPDGKESEKISDLKKTTDPPERYWFRITKLK